MSEPVRIVAEPLQRERGTLWTFRTSDGQKHATRNAFFASLAKEYYEKQTPVIVDSSAGWFYRDVYGITPAEAK